jgi:CBS domain containing-hemolysin-like protein
MPTATDLSGLEILVRLAVVLLLVLANGFFVAAEFALVGSRRTRIEALARAGNRRAKIARSAIVHLSDYLPATQLGITLASLGLGWVGEGTLAAMLAQWFRGLPSPWAILATHTVAGVLAFIAITFMHIVLGELAPKNLAILSPERTSLWTAGPLVAFTRTLKPFIWVLNRAAALVLRGLGLHSPSEMERVHRPEEIEMLVTQSYEHGLLAEEPVEMIRGVFDLSETTAAEVMTPRTDIVAVEDTATVDEVADVILTEGHSRIPVYHGTVDHIVGVVLARDVWRAERAGGGPIEPLIRPVPFIPDTKSIEDLLREMQEERFHLAVVIDEFGGTAGVVTIEDLLEEIVGEISDEHEAGSPDIQELPTGEILLTGGTPIFELNERYRMELPEDDYTTVGGYVLGRLGRIAQKGDEVFFRTGRLRVLEMEGRRVARLALFLARPEPTDDEDEAVD